jgi:hypothetical protein
MGVGGGGEKLIIIPAPPETKSGSAPSNFIECA